MSEVVRKMPVPMMLEMVISTPSQTPKPRTSSGCAGFAEVVTRADEVDDLLGVMMDVDDEVVGAGFDEATCDALEHGDAADVDQCLRGVACELAEPCAQAGGQDHCVHSRAGSLSVGVPRVRAGPR